MALIAHTLMTTIFSHIKKKKKSSCPPPTSNNNNNNNRKILGFSPCSKSARKMD
jgi:hypothetical protein